MDDLSVACYLREVLKYVMVLSIFLLFFFQAEDGIRDLVRSRGLGDVYKRQNLLWYGASGLALFGLFRELILLCRPAWAARARILSLIHI